MISRPSCPIKLVNGITLEIVDATLFEGLSEKNLHDHENIWGPALRQANITAKENGSQTPIAEDAHWSWTKKIDVTAGQLAYRHYAIEHEGNTEGLMSITLVGHQSRKEPLKDLVYIDFVSVAPSNRQGIQNPPKLKAIGSVLFQCAVQISIDEGMKGRVGLHALPNAATWYRDKLGLDSFGSDPSYHNLEYFELTEEHAKKLIRSMNT